jgi:hypothetical protein
MEEVSIYNQYVNSNNVKIATGFVNAFDSPNPKDSLVNPIKPSGARRGTVPYQAKMTRMYELGMTFQLLLMRNDPDKRKK